MRIDNMIKSVLSKIKNNIWRFVCLIVGSLLIAGILSSIPIYTEGTLRQMIDIELGKYEDENGVPAGQMYITAKIPGINFGMSRVSKLEEIHERVNEGVNRPTPLYLNGYTQISADKLAPEAQAGAFEYSTSYKLSAISDFEDNITLVDGRIYSDGLTSEGAIEVVLYDEYYRENPEIELGNVYEFRSVQDGNSDNLKIIPVGVFEITDETSEFWHGLESFSYMLFASKLAFESLIYTDTHVDKLTDTAIYCNFDFRGITVSDLPFFVDYYNGLCNYLKTLGVGRSAATLNCARILNSYREDSASLQMALWVLNIPIIAMLALYMVMASKMIIEEDRNEISTFKSRGAKTGKIFLRYVIECGFISVFTVIIGPFLGYAAASFIGSASGFLEFSSSESVKMYLSGWAFVYAIAACLIFSAMILIPALSVARSTIVNLKQGRARKGRFAFWEKSFLDVIILAVAVGLLIIYERTSGFNTDGTVDPIVYVISSLFIFGCGLLFIRIYPFIVALVFAPFKRVMRPPMYSAFVHIARGSSGDYRFLMLFLIMTIAVGIYSSGSARIINNNVENTVLYTYGADAVIEPDFSEYSPYVIGEDGSVTAVPEPFRSFPLSSYAEKDYIETVSRVAYFNNNFVMSTSVYGAYADEISIMAIDPYEFAHVAWCGEELNDIDWHYYINMIELNPSTVVISSSLARQCGVSVGDTIQIDINGSNEYEYEYWKSLGCQVVGIVDYWPTATSHLGEDPEVGRLNEKFVIMNFEYIYSVRDTSSYKLFLSLNGEAADVSNEESFAELLISDGLIKSEEEVSVYRPEIMANEKNDSLLKGLNGSFSIGFISTLTVAFVGFLIYWIMNVRKRKLQFGILRAMGFTKSGLTRLLIWEHLLTTGVSVLMGTVIGAFTVKLYAPLLKIAYSECVLPLKVVFERSDNMKIFAVMGMMIAAGIAVLAVFISRLKINEAVKIGEE